MPFKNQFPYGEKKGIFTLAALYSNLLIFTTELTCLVVYLLLCLKKQCGKPKCTSPSWTIFATAGMLAKAKHGDRPRNFGLRFIGVM